MRVASAPTVAVTSVLWRSRPDAFMRTVVCKATFLLKPNQTATLVSPEAPATADILWHRESQSIGVPSDLAPFKRNVDVLLIGHAYAPQRRPATALQVGLSIGTLTKSILVTGDRSWEPNGTCPDPEPFLRTPLCWERAAGGPSTWNPVGLPVGARIDPQTRPRIPNLLPRGFVLQNATHLIPPVGFGALAPQWPARAAYVQKWGASWNHAKWYESVLPAELDAVYFNAAPGDQQLRELPETTQLTLDHLHPDMPRLVTMVDDLRPRALITRTPGTAPQELWLRADTLLIDVDRVTCSMTWRATVALRHPQEDGVIYVEPTRGLGAAAPVKSHAVLPFQQQAFAAPPTSALTNQPVAPNSILANRPNTPDTGRRDVATTGEEIPTLPLQNDAPATAAGLPFRPSNPSSPPGALPFAKPPPPRRESPSMSAIPANEEATAVVRDKPVVDASPLPFRPPSPSQTSFRADDDEVTAIHQPIPRRPASQPAEAKTAVIPPVPVAAAPQQAPAGAPGIKVGKTLIPDTPPAKESALPFRPVAQTPEDPNSARNRFAAMSASSVLPFQTQGASSETPPPRERMPSVPPTSAVTVPVPMASANASPSAPVAPSPPAPLPTPPPARASGLPFQTPATNEAPPPPRERLPSVPAVGLPFGVPLGGSPPPPMAIPAPAPSASGLPFQTPATNDAPPPPREKLPSISLVGTPFSASAQPSLPTTTAHTPFSSQASDAPRPMSWSRLSGPNDDFSPSPPPVKSDVAITPKPKPELSFERYARIKVNLWSPDASREDVLREHGMDEVEWRILEQQQTEALEVEAKEGRCDLALALVAAFEAAATAPKLAPPSLATI